MEILGFLRYIDTKPNGGGLKKSILSGPYVPTTVQVQAVEAAEGCPAVSTTIHHIEMKIYSTVDDCNTANEMWLAIEKATKGESFEVTRYKDQSVLGNLGSLLLEIEILMESSQ
ncbi:hypothetical protein Tco_0791517 [Tanacetum coccineum]